MKKAIFIILLVFCLCCASAFAIDYSNVNFSDFKAKQFMHKNVEKSYYDSFNIYYKSYDYQGYECITEYYLVGNEQGKEEIIMYCCFENNNSQLVATRYDAQGTASLSTSISGYLHYEDRNVYSHSDIEVYGILR